MRRMLDPKTIGGGGGSTSTAMHGYSVVIGDRIHYEVYTQKDYDLELREATYISDFSTNPKYQELRSNGLYPASGYYYKNDKTKIIGDKIQVNEIESSGFHTAEYYIQGYNLSNNSYEGTTISGPSISVIKNF